MQCWNWHEKPKRNPILYGCWHPYKSLVTNVWRRFHTLFVYFRFGRLGVGKTVGSYPKMRVMERTIAGVLKCVPHFLRQLRRKSNRLQDVSDHGGTAMDRPKSVVLPGDGGRTEVAMSVTATVTVTVPVPEVHATHLLPSHTPSLMYF